jgi:hypothetical protein
MGNSNQIVSLEETAVVEMEVDENKDDFTQNFISKSRIGIDLIRMRVKVIRTF